MAVRQTADEAFNERYDGTGAGRRDTSDTNRRLAGRTNAPKDSTRNVRAEVRRSNMPGAPKNESFVSDKRDIATEFNASYATRGIQPSYAVVNTNEAPKQQRYEQPEQITRSERYTEQQEAESQGMVPKGRKTQKRRTVIRKKLGAKSAVTKARVSGLNIWVWGWGLWSWLFLQLPFALASLLFLAFHEAIHQLWKVIQVKDEDGFFLRITKGLAERVFSNLFAALDYLSETLFNIDLDLISPANFALLTYLVVLALGWFTLFLIWFLYRVNFINSTGGSGAGLKLGTLLLAFVGYATPVANIFPWFVFWTMAVWWHPK